jgi:glucosamine--fructose-6-phosphate aminotransferase (isomerizing)
MATRESEGTIYTHAGPEIGVASTKAFTAQLVALHLLALHLAQARGTLSSDQRKSHIAELLQLPQQIEHVLKCAPQIEDIASRFHSRSDFLYLGRGINYPIALEGALKLKEISYIHAEGYPAGEMKHGPIALIDENMPVVVIAEKSAVYDKVISNLEVVRARDGQVIAVATEGDTEIVSKANEVIYIPDLGEYLTAILAVVPLQLLAYHVAMLKGTDVDQPRNLAKSVTVE